MSGPPREVPRRIVTQYDIARLCRSDRPWLTSPMPAGPHPRMAYDSLQKSRLFTKIDNSYYPNPLIAWARGELEAEFQHNKTIADIKETRKFNNEGVLTDFAFNPAATLYGGSTPIKQYGGTVSFNGVEIGKCSSMTVSVGKDIPKTWGDVPPFEVVSGTIPLADADRERVAKLFKVGFEKHIADNVSDKIQKMICNHFDYEWTTMMMSPSMTSDFITAAHHEGMEAWKLNPGADDASRWRFVNDAIGRMMRPRPNVTSRYTIQPKFDWIRLILWSIAAIQASWLVWANWALIAPLLLIAAVKIHAAYYSGLLGASVGSLISVVMIGISMWLDHARVNSQLETNRRGHR